MELTKEEKIEALKYALECIENEKLYSDETTGICFYLIKVISKFKYYNFISHFDLCKYIPEFIFQNNLHISYWFPENDFDSRINYLKNLIEKIENGN